jgi:hypothetical protein
MPIEQQGISVNNLLAYLKFATLNAMAFSLLYLAYGNGFVWKSRPSAYCALVVGPLTAKDGYTQDFYCLTAGQNMKIWYILLHILNVFMNLLCIY